MPDVLVGPRAVPDLVVAPIPLSGGHQTGGAAVTKFVFVTGGVSSSLGKGLTASSLGRLLKSVVSG